MGCTGVAFLQLEGQTLHWQKDDDSLYHGDRNQTHNVCKVRSTGEGSVVGLSP